MTLRFSLLLVLLLLAACDSADVPIPDPVPVDPVVAGVNLDTLLAAPTAAERSAVLTELGQRAEAVVPEDFAVVTTSGGSGPRVQVVSFTSPFPAGVGRLYGAIRVPARPPGSHERLPVLVVVPEGEGDVSTAGFLTDGPYAELGEAFIQVLLAPPGASLHAGSTAYESEPLPEAFTSLYDYEVDLTRALLKAALGEHVAVADAERIGYAGFGRGGTVALLLAARPASPTYPFDPVAVAAVAPFTDYAAPSFRNVVSRLLRDQSPPFPGSADLAAYDFELDPFQVAGCAALEDGRGVLVAAPTVLMYLLLGKYFVRGIMAGSVKG